MVNTLQEILASLRGRPERTPEPPDFDAHEILTRLRTLSAGQSMVYWRGMICDRRTYPLGVSHDDIRLIHATAWDLYKAGMIALLQRRISDGYYEYIAQGKRKPEPTT